MGAMTKKPLTTSQAARIRLGILAARVGGPGRLTVRQAEFVVAGMLISDGLDLLALQAQHRELINRHGPLPWTIKSNVGGL